MLEWAHFRKYARRIRRLDEHCALGGLPPKVLSVLQLHALNEPFFPNLEILRLWFAGGELIPFIPLFLSPRTTLVSITFNKSDCSEALVVSLITTLPTLCPNLQDITLHFLPRDPVVTAAASRLLLTDNRKNLRSFNVDSPLTEDARGAVFQLPDLQGLALFIEKDASFPSAMLPNVTDLAVRCDYGSDCLRILRGATFGKLEAISFASDSGRIDNFLEEFERFALATSTQNTLSEFHLYASCSWNPNYPSLLPFVHLKNLTIEFPCEVDCSSRVDDAIIMDLARTMRKLEILQLGGPPCSEIPTGVTTKGLLVLANHCPDLHNLRIHFQASSLSTPPVVPTTTFNGFTAPRRDCALTNLEVGEIPVAEESVSVVALTLVRIFPRIESIDFADENWGKVIDAICVSREIIGYSGEEHLPSAP